MGGFLKGYERHEKFMLPGEWEILIDYGGDARFPREKIIWGYEKGISTHMRSKLFKQGIFITEAI